MDSGTVINSGRIDEQASTFPNKYSIEITAGGAVVNNSGGYIFGIRIGGTGSVSNSGMIRGNSGVQVGAGSTVSNDGSILGGFNSGVSLHGGNGFLTNTSQGMIQGIGGRRLQRRRYRHQ